MTESATPKEAGAGPVLRLLLVADLAPGSEAAAAPLSLGEGPAALDAALATLAPRLSTTVPDRLGAGRREWAVALAPAGLADFAPAALARSAWPGLARVRQRLAAVARGELSVDGADAAGGWPDLLDDAELAAQVRAVAARPLAPEVGGGALDSLLAQVALPAAPLAERPLAELLAGPFTVSSAAATGEELERRLLRAGVDLADAPAVRELAAAWQGAARLQAAAGGGADVRLELLPAARDEALEAFYDVVFPEEYEERSAVPLAAVLLGFEVDRGAEDVERLRQAARMGASLSVPFLGAVAPGFWGIRQPKLLANLPNLGPKLKGSEYGKWNGLRAEEASLWLCLAANRLELGSAHPGSTAGPLYGPGSWALGVELIHAFRDGGARFPAVAFPGAAEVALSDGKAQEIAELGLAPLVAGREAGTVRFLALPALHAPKRYDRPQATLASAAAATLPFQAFTGAAARALRQLARGAEGLSLPEIEARVTAGLADFLTTCGETPEGIAGAVKVEVETDPAQPHLAQVAARLTPSFAISGSEVDLVLGAAVAH